MRKTTLRQWLASGAAAGALSLAIGAHAQAEQVTFTFDQPEMPLGAALQSVGRETGVNILVDSRLVNGVQAKRLRGDLSADEALVALLDGTGLTVRKTDASSVMIVRADSPQSGSAAGDGAEVEALIVTAQKREEDIQDVPIAISAFTQEDLTRSQVAGGPDLITQVPNMTFTKTNFSSYSIQLRGIGTQAISATTDPAVAVAFNNTPFIRNRFFEQEFYDLQRVEVLRGPQGTLYGRNATAGVVNIISQKPRYNFEAKASADVSNFNSSRIEGMVNIPLVEDMVALRLAGAWTKRDGYATNELSDDPIDGRDLWSTRLSLRITPNERIDANLIWEHFQENDDRLRSGKQLCKKDVVTEVGGIPVDNYFQPMLSNGQGGSLWAGVQAVLSQGCKPHSLYAQGSFQRPNGLMLPYYVPVGAIGLPIALKDPYVGISSIDPFVVDATNDQPENLRVIQSLIDPTYRADSDIGEFQISIDLTDNLTLSSETAYGVDSVYSLQDFNRFNSARGAWFGAPGDELVTRGILVPTDAGTYAFCDPQLGCADRLLAVDVSTAKARQFTQEFRLSSDFDGPFNFSVGANYMRADSEDKYYVFINSLSLLSAAGRTGSGLGPYVRGETDNSGCGLTGYAPGDPNNSVFPVGTCTFMDPNPIESVNDEGHNYFLSKNPYKLISYALFGEAYYNIADNLKLTAGLRWTVDKKDAPRIPSWILAGESAGYPVAEVIEQEWREPTGRLALDWKPELSFTDETLVYASYAHGYKAGGANPPGYARVYYGDPTGALAASRESATRPRVFQPEFVDAFEAGAKNTFLGGRATANLAAFYYDYKDYQISEIVDRSAFNRNFDATVWGVELEADWRPIENLRLGFKGGYEKTRIADGEQAIDLMDRTAGDPNYVVARPFPVYASSCILPVTAFVGVDTSTGNPALANPGNLSGGGLTGCEIAYTYGHDPVTDAPYVDLTDPNAVVVEGPLSTLNFHPGYAGWDPATAPNGGEGIMKPLGGNALPNAPEWTGTITADYTIPLPNEWLVNLHTDVHWQAQSYWRLFQDNEFSVLDEYFTMNLAAIFTNEERGWNVMAYIKNVTDETAITGAFLNSDDTGLTTNVFLTEPRLYGLRVTKNWSGGPLLGSFGARRDGPRPLTIELGGQVERIDAPTVALMPPFASAFETPYDILDDAQRTDLDWGDGRDVKVTWRPGGPWSLSAAVRFGKTNGHSKLESFRQTDPVCGFGSFYSFLCPKYDSPNPRIAHMARFSMPEGGDSYAIDREEHQIVELSVGRDFGFGVLEQSKVAFGLRRATLESTTETGIRGIPDWVIQEGFFQGAFPGADGLPSTHSIYNVTAWANREFEGWGPVVSWEASYPLISNQELGRVGVEWEVSGGVLVGDREATVRAEQMQRFYFMTGQELGLGYDLALLPAPDVTTVADPINLRRSDNATVPTLNGSLGLSYEVGAFKVGAGYRWERYYNALDVGYDEAEDGDRTIDGPYFKVSLGFGG